MTPVAPLFTIDLFSELDQKLIELLHSLPLDDWNRQTIAPLWTIKDVAAHLLDGNVRGISIGRDAYFGSSAPVINSYQDLVRFLNQLNASWTTATQRISPPLLIDLLQLTGRQYLNSLKTLDPFDKAVFSVAWAGEEISQNWFHIAREYTEKWHHQQQIRLAVGQDEALLTKELYLPFLDTVMRALPHHYRNVTAHERDVIQFSVTEDRGNWYLLRTHDQWQLLSECDFPVTCTVLIDYKIAWRIFMKGIIKDDALKHVTITGKTELGEPVMTMLSVMA